MWLINKSCPDVEGENSRKLRDGGQLLRTLPSLCEPSLGTLYGQFLLLLLFVLFLFWWGQLNQSLTNVALTDLELTEINLFLPLGLKAPDAGSPNMQRVLGLVPRLAGLDYNSCTSS